MSARDQFRAAIAAAGLTAPDTITPYRGKIERFSSNGKKSDDSGWYYFHDDDRPYGEFGDYRTGLRQEWKADRPATPPSAEERQRWADQKRQREEAAAREREQAANQAADLWSRAQPCNGHPYLQRKQINGTGARELDGVILVPMRHGPGSLVGLQRIYQDGDKKFLHGTPSAGAYAVIGKPTRTGPIVICEGYATSESVHLATGMCVVVAFNAGNLEAVARKIRQAMPEAALIIGADDDKGTEERTGTNPGIEAATKAALAVGGTLVRPLWLGERGAGTDFNDLAVDEGLDAVRMCFEDPQPIDPPKPTTDKPASVGAPPAPNNTGSHGRGAPPRAMAVVEPLPAVVPDLGGVPRLDQVPAASSDDPFDDEPPRDDGERPLIFNSTPMKTAELFHDTLPEGGRILFWRGEFYSWDSCRYVVRDPVYIEQRLYLFMAGCDTWKIDPKTGDHEVVAYNPKAANVRDVLHALRAVCFTPAPEAGTWIEPRAGDPPGSEIIAFRNCFLHWPTRRTMPPTDRLLITTALEFDYESNAAAPTEWLRFLDNLWPNDPESIQALGEMFGYMLTDDTSQQKIFMLIGPPRCGKGTILRVLESLVGKSNRCSPSLSSLGGPFGLQSLLGKRLAMISDARLSGKADQHAIVENLLRISGEDAVDVNRKNLPSLDGVLLRCRFVMATNELPAFTDASSALPNRFIPFRFITSFLGTEDHGLTSRLLQELSGVLLWALDGLDRLRARGYFVTPASAQEVSDEFMEQTSPIKAFVRDVCTLGEGNLCERDDLFKAWKRWCEDQGRDHAGTKVSFGRQLSAAFPGVRRTQRRDGGTRSNEYSGIRLTHKWEHDGEPY